MQPLNQLYDAFFTRGGGYAMADRVRGFHALSTVRFLRRLESLDNGSRRALLNETLRETLMSARGAPHYEKLFRRRKLDPRRMDPFELVESLPVTTKQDLRSSPESFIRKGFEGEPGKIQTAGSTGQPLRAFVDPRIPGEVQAAMLYGRSWWGIQPGARAVSLWGHSKYLNEGWRDKARLARRRLMDAAMNRRVFPAYDLSPERLADFVKLVRRFRPRLIVGYASALYAAARYVIDEGNARTREAFASVKVVVSTGEMVYDFQKEDIGEAFGAPVAVEYGLCEGGVVSYTHPDGNHYALDGLVHVELLDQDNQPVKSGEAGRIVITRMQCRDVPLLRYDTGDMAREAKPAPNPLGMRRLSQLQGRAYDLIEASNGRKIPGVLFTHAMKYVEEVDRYQIVQRQPGAVTIYYVSPEELSPQSRGKVSEKIRHAADEPLQIGFERRDTLESERSGKFRWIRSELSSA